MIGVKRVLAILILLGAAPAAAADYPYSGVFVLASPEGVDRKIDFARCAFGFFIQAKDGLYTNYHLDLWGFKATKKPRYLEYGGGRCTYDAAARSETCAATWSSASGPLATYQDVIESLTPDEVRTREFADTADLAKWQVSRNDTLGYSVRYLACPFTAEKLAPFLMAERTTLPREDLDKIISDIPSTGDQAVMKEVYGALGVAWPGP